jgi:CRP/FNR family transcriptional regulator, cyclic AMP receptor protein
VGDRGVEMLRSVPLFKGLSQRELTEVLEAGREYEFAPGESIVEQGLEAMDFYVMLDGEARLQVPGGRTARLGPGDYFGEISLLDGGPRTASITAETRVLTLRLDRTRFIALLDRHGSIARKILAEMAARLRTAEGGLPA